MDGFRLDRRLIVSILLLVLVGCWISGTTPKLNRGCRRHFGYDGGHQVFTAHESDKSALRVADG
jgi:hypothetical protein